VVGGASGTPWDEPEPLDRPRFTKFEGRWGEYESGDLRSKFVAMVGGPPTGPKFDRDGGIRKKWNQPAKYAGLIR